MYTPKSACSHSSIASEVRAKIDHCTECGLCVRHCAFLQRYGSPAAIVRQHNFSLTDHRQLAYRCSLCGLCTALCPQGVRPDHFFLTLRRQQVQSRTFSFRPYRALLWYEWLGSSPLLAWYGLSRETETIFFPGCGLAATRPWLVFTLTQWLQRHYPHLGIVLDCCNKPSHDLGRQDFFQRRLLRLQQQLAHKKIRRIITTCPSCTQIFTTYTPQYEIQTIYEILATKLPRLQSPQHTTVTIHDPCPLRYRPEFHAALRQLAQTCGYPVAEMEHYGKTTLCCGEGGGVLHLDPALAHSWTQRRVQESKQVPLLTCCTGCTSLLGKHLQCSHVLDLCAPLLGRQKIRTQPLLTPWSYWHRFLLKQRLKKIYKKS